MLETVHFDGIDVAELVDGLVDDQAVVDQAGSVDQAGNGAHLVSDGLDGRVQSGPVGDVGTVVSGGNTGSLQCGDGLLDGPVGDVFVISGLQGVGRGPRIGEGVVGGDGLLHGGLALDSPKPGRFVKRGRTAADQGDGGPTGAGQ